MNDEGPDDGHQFHFSVSCQGSSAVVGEPHQDADWIGTPWTLTVRAWSLSAACTRAASVPLHEWSNADWDEDAAADPG